MKQLFNKKIKFIFSKKGIKFLWSICLMILIYPITLFLKNHKKYKNIWLIAERGNEATDNAYVLFSYIMNNNIHENIFYIIHKKYKDITPLREYKGNIIETGSLKHFMYFALSSVCISTQTRMATPNPVIAKWAKKWMPIKKNYVYLGHGLIKDHLPHLHKHNLKADLIIVDTHQEKEYFIKQLRYEEKQVVITGRPRHDLLSDLSSKDTILILPTNRLWVASLYNKELSNEQFQKTLFYKQYQSLINNTQLLNHAKKNNLQIIFYLHPNTMVYSKYFTSKSPNVTIIHNMQPSIRHFIKRADLLVTDYSSVAFDFAYLYKPVIYFQFDYERFKSEQYPLGWFSYEKDGFGHVFSEVETLVEEIKRISNDNFIISDYYKNRINDLYVYHDGKNRQRTVKAIEQITKNKK